jgi:hypothetical protein
MGFITHQNEQDAAKEGLAKNESDADLLAEARKRRIATLRRVAGIWANRTDIPADGIEYERELRDEWR